MAAVRGGGSTAAVQYVVVAGHDEAPYLDGLAAVAGNQEVRGLQVMMYDLALV